ncbi:CbiX/SirB N-terminal domain-containing protein [Rhodobacter ferrooxidans]|uniref:Cobalamin (Vitamin B12) biosynthesis CbiX protein n=1 Tax=Rhodobacter ferrooxidans TaxID=371731 RepID=C8RZA1_9RHOB|nr:CbiX/SirB N-terminal domain-containing protein [Rhodobacter sp. SW2]EEW26058.1 cobalamin (vitamin B12) biosynthesis CbiX protein [Rhodobacter sp. SW2]
MTQTALIVAHGAPADPAPAQVALEALATTVAGLLPGWRIAGATLAAPDALEEALAACPGALIYPFFMAEGWFTRTALPRRLTAAGATGLHQLPAFGTDPRLTDLVARAALQGAEAAGLTPKTTTLLLAAHGGKASPASAQATQALAARLAQRGDFAAIRVGFLEQEPFLADAARGLGAALCLPLFALRAGHLARDVPQALRDAGFTCPLLPAIGEHPDTPALIARALGAVQLPGRKALQSAGSVSILEAPSRSRQ